MKGAFITCCLMAITLIASAQGLYKHAVGISFGNYVSFTTAEHQLVENGLVGYAYTVGFDHVYRPGKRFALNTRLGYSSFQNKREYPLRFGNQFNGTGFDPNIDSGESIDAIVFSERIGAINVALIPNVYLLNKGKLGLYLLAGAAFEMQLHQLSTTNISSNDTKRTFLPDETDDVGTLMDVAFISGIGVEYAVADKHILRMEPVCIVGVGAPDNFYEQRIFTGVNLSYVFAAK